MASDLEIGETLAFGLAQQSLVQLLEGVQGLELRRSVDDVHQLVDEPAVYLGELVYLFRGITVDKSLGNDEDAVVGRLPEGLVNVLYRYFLIACEAVRSLADHSQTLLQGLLEGASDGHDLTDALHAAADLAGDSVELGEVPAGNLADYVVQGGLEECRSGLGDGVLQLEQAVAQAELCGHEGQGITGRFRCQCRGTAQTGVDLDDAVVLGIGVEGELHVALADDAHVADDPYRKLAEQVVLMVGEGLRGSDHDTLAGMDAERVEVLHVADRDAVVETVAHHLVLYLLPTLEGFLDQYLR